MHTDVYEDDSNISRYAAQNLRLQSSAFLRNLKNYFLVSVYLCSAEGDGSSQSGCRMRQDTQDSMQWSMLSGRTPSGRFGNRRYLSDTGSQSHRYLGANGSQCNWYPTAIGSQSHRYQSVQRTVPGHHRQSVQPVPDFTGIWFHR